MRILVITDEIYPDAIGGVGKSLYNECLALVNLGHDVQVLVRSTNHELPVDSVIEGLKIERFFGPERRQLLYYLYPLVIIYKVTKWLRRYSIPYDVLYLHNSIYVIPIRFARINPNVPVICTFYSAVNDYIQSNIERGKYGRLTGLARIAASIMGKIERWAFSRVDSVLPRSLYSLEELRRLYPQAKVFSFNNLIPLGINISHYFPRSKADARLQLNLPSKRPIFITVRRLDGRMGLSNLIQAVKIVREKHPDMLLLIVGKGYLRSTLERLISENGLSEHVHLLGFVSEEKLPQYLSASDVFVLPTESQEGFGLATIEAMASGIPVIGTPVGATPEILRPIEPKLLTKDASTEALADSISYWLDHADELGTLGVVCREAVETHYNADLIADALEDFFTSMVIAKADRK